MYVLHTKDYVLGAEAHCKVLVLSNTGKVDEIYVLEPTPTELPFMWGLYTLGCIHLAQRILFDALGEITLATELASSFAHEVLALIPIESTLRLLSDTQVEEYAIAAPRRGIC
jgi:hypothetical protein